MAETSTPRSRRSRERGRKGIALYWVPLPNVFVERLMTALKLPDDAARNAIGEACAELLTQIDFETGRVRNFPQRVAPMGSYSNARWLR